MKISSIIKTVALSIPIGITFVDCVGYVARVEGVSMQPCFNPLNPLNPDFECDYVFLSRWAIRNYTYDRGDVVSMISPKDPEQKIIKRVVALQGDVVSTIGYKKPYVKIPDGFCWVEGDHTGNSLDSNTFGPVSAGLITARATYIVWPPNRWQKILSHLPKQRKPISLGKSVKQQQNVTNSKV